MLGLHVAFIALLIGTQAFFTLLAIKNVGHADRTVRSRAAWLADRLGIDDHEELLQYHRITTAFSQLRSWIALGALLVVLYSGLFTRAVEAANSFEFGPVLEGTLFIIGAIVVVQLFSVPFAVVSTFGIEEIFGFNEQSPTLFVRDTVLNTVISAGLTVVVAGAVLWFIEAYPTWWPVAAWALVIGFSLLMQIVYPRVIAPLFNDFEPVADGDLREAVEDVFDRAGFSCEQIYTMDASRRSTHLNAYFTGFGETKRVVLFDTLVEKLSLPAVQSVLAHELAHWKKAHIWKQVGASAIQLAIVFGVLGYLVSAEPLYAMFGLPTEATYAGLLVGVVVVSPVLELTAPLSNRLSLKHEREADAFAVSVMGEGQSMIDALAALARENLANPFPDPTYATFHYSHPPIPERIRLIEEQMGDSTAEQSGDADGKSQPTDADDKSQPTDADTGGSTAL